MQMQKDSFLSHLGKTNKWPFNDLCSSYHVPVKNVFCFFLIIYVYYSWCFVLGLPLLIIITSGVVFLFLLFICKLSD